MELDQKQKQELEELLDILVSVRGRHTELVTVMIPAGFNISSVVRQLEAEKSTAANIKSKATRTAVEDSLERIIRELKNYKQTPKNGLAAFAGNISQKEGVQDLKLWLYEPAKPLNVRIYRCDQVFIIDPLKEMLEAQEIYGLLVIDRQEATIGILEGKQIKLITHMTSGVPGKVRAGGQCLSPDTLVIKDNGEKIKIRDIKIGDKIKALDVPNRELVYTKCTKIWKNTKSSYLEIKTSNNNLLILSEDHTLFILEGNKLKEITADMTMQGAVLLNDKKEKESITKITKIKNKIGLIDIETISENFFANNILVHNSSQRFHRITEGLAKEFFRRVSGEMKKVFFEMPKLKGILVGGPIPTKEEFLEEGDLPTTLRNKVIAVKDLGYTDMHGLELLVEQSQQDIAEQELVKEKNILAKFFETLGKHREKAAYGLEKVKLALQRGAVDILLISKKLPKNEAEELEKAAANIGAEIIIISTDNQYGEQFLNLTKGVGAVLRFALE
ncbi:MAG: hypothetical protein Q7S27_03795 [Nanoarchaeota archaeon]|nr:hypothetical protein [Nanoarchaeota archaeon]